MSRISRDELNIKIAELYSQRSSCGRLKVGCIVVRDNRIISTGYNGPLKSQVKDDICNCDLSKPCEQAIHAEANLIAYSAKNGISLKDSTLYCTQSPCKNCAYLIIQAGIINVIYLHEFRDIEGITLMQKNGVFVNKYEKQV